MKPFASDDLARAFTENRERLLALVHRGLKPILLKRFDYEDILSAAYENAAKRLAYFAANTEVPVYFKLRTVLLQTLTDIERKHLGAGSRDAYKEIQGEESRMPNDEDAGPRIEFAADMTSPVSKVDRSERHALLLAAVEALPENDRQIIVLRHFDHFSNGDCADILGIEPKAASIRYVRALEKLQKKLTEISCFRR